MPDKCDDCGREIGWRAEYRVWPGDKVYCPACEDKRTADQRKPLPCGLIVINGGKMLAGSMDRFAKFMNDLKSGKTDCGIVVLDLTAVESPSWVKPSDVKIEYHSFITGETLAIQNVDEFAEAIKRGDVKYAVKEEDDGREQG